jgi:rhamnose utilization protein RhaD (predicted bifunctional aldolase and dehydrogenase)
MKKDTLVKDYVSLSKALGSKTEDVQWWWGNVSIKTSDRNMYIKASWTLLKDITSKNIGAQIDYKKIKHWMLPLLSTKSIKTSDKEIDKIIQENTSSPWKRASIETSMHIILPQKIVFHNHSIYVNIFACAKNGDKHLQTLFGKKVAHIDYSSPWAWLSMKIFKKHWLKAPNILMLKNHGIILHADSIKEIKVNYVSIIKSIKDFLKKKWIKLFKNEAITVNKWIYAANLYPSNTLKKIILKKKLSKHLYPDSIVFGEDIIFDGKKNQMQMNKVVVQTGNAQKDISILENLLAINYILYVHQMLWLATEFLSSKDIRYILDMEQEKYRKALYDKNKTCK